MFKDKLDNLKELFKKKTEGNNKKNIENLVVFLIILIITIIAINTIWGDKEKTKPEMNNSYKELADNIDNKINSNNKEFNEYNLEENLEKILGKISGVGKVQVLITYSQTSQVVAMYNEKNISSNTEETDTNGGTRKIETLDSDKEIIYEEKNGEKTPITEKVIMPKIEGAIITAEGASNPNTKSNIINAVAAATGLSTYKIQVFEMST